MGQPIRYKNQNAKIKMTDKKLKLGRGEEFEQKITKAGKGGRKKYFLFAYSIFVVYILRR